METTTQATPLTDATRQALDALWQEATGQLTEEQGQALLAKREEALTTLRTLATPLPPNSVTIEVLASDVLDIGDGELIEEECAADVFGPVVIERGVFHRDGESVVPGETMLDREKEVGLRIGPKTAAALERQPEKIPAHWRGTYLVVTGVVKRDSNRYRKVLYFFWYGKRWKRFWNWLDSDYDRSYQSLRSRP